jgi:hypothetical protein
MSCQSYCWRPTVADQPARRDNLQMLDDRIDLVWQFVIAARAAFLANPNSHRERDAVEAEGEMNRLLERRSRITAEQAPAVVADTVVQA